MFWDFFCSIISRDNGAEDFFALHSLRRYGKGCHFCGYLLNKFSFRAYLNVHLHRFKFKIYIFSFKEIKKGAMNRQEFHPYYLNLPIFSRGVPFP